MILVIADSDIYMADNLIPGAGEVFTDENGLLDLSSYDTEDWGDGVAWWGGPTP